jgi:hypothetical protein
MRKFGWHIITILIILILVSCSDPLNPITNVYKVLTNGQDHISLEESKILVIEVADFSSGNVLKKAKVNARLPDGRILLTVTDTLGLASINLGGGEIPEGNCEIEACFNIGSGHYYGNWIFYMTAEMNSTVTMYVNKGNCETKYIKMY